MSAITALWQQTGVILVPLLFCSLLSLGVIVERLFSLRRRALFPDASTHSLFKTFRETPPHLPIAGEFLHFPLGRIVHYAGERTLLAAFLQRLQTQARREQHHLQRGLVLLEVVAGVAPLLGLLGTALGMVEVFQTLNLEGAQRSAVLSQGISQALFTTVLGLVVAIPSFVAFHLFQRHIEGCSLQLDTDLQRIAEIVESQAATGSS